MKEQKRMKQVVLVFFVIWLLLIAVAGYSVYLDAGVGLPAGVLVLSVLFGLSGVWMFNTGQQQVVELNKSHSRTKRQLQELQLKIDRYEYDAKKSSELRRIVLNSTQEKDHAVQNMARALDKAMDEILLSVDDLQTEPAAIVKSKAMSMKQYAADLLVLAKLELKSELPEPVEIDFNTEIDRLMSQWNSIARSRKIKIKLDNPEHQISMYTDVNWVENLLTRLVLALLRMNRDTLLHIGLITYTDAELGDSLRLAFSIEGRTLTAKQLAHIAGDYISVIDEGQEVGPGLSFVVGRRVAQMLNGSFEVTSSENGIEALVVIPRREDIEEQDTFS
ncbi:signal transduction histidine kinase [Reinekea marinisedimentorum]|uniref:Signal transduction histidine kinase n=2 Tax=Reinekea marinisedimentorum TaxID=230495 RepID=A0A4R3I690_9GAMM|nr:signal transduction histidine kinase [Reinekea marinisedimentorum]